MLVLAILIIYLVVMEHAARPVLNNEDLRVR
jgi:hypothetical protein